MIATLVTSFLNSLSLLSPVEVVAAVAAIVYGVGGLVALWTVDDRSRVSTAPVGTSRPSHPPFKAAA